MSYKKLIPVLYLKMDQCYRDAACKEQLGNGNPVIAAEQFSNQGADELIVLDLSDSDVEHEQAIGIIRKISRAVDIPVNAGGYVQRVEDVKKYLYAGARTAILDDRKESNLVMMKEVTDRFGKTKIGLYYTGTEKQALEMAEDCGLSYVIMDTNVLQPSDLQWKLHAGIPAVVFNNAINPSVLADEHVIAWSGYAVNSYEYDFMKMKQKLKGKGIKTNTFESAIPYSEFKLNSDGLIPVVVQDYKTDDVLMVAYMNEESYNKTISTGRMTYWSRSRQELWMKGLTSGHFQYVRSIEIDCDNDTLLAKVKQIGAACHTGNRSCFYRNLVSTEYAETNPLKVFNRVMQIIEDRREHPKEGSYTNYLFDKGIDKILKKCGEEATEIIIAAKNPDPEEIKYEISDFLYHVMVLMVLRGVTWDDIVRELDNR